MFNDPGHEPILQQNLRRLIRGVRLEKLAGQLVDVVRHDAFQDEIAAFAEFQHLPVAQRRRTIVELLQDDLHFSRMNSQPNPQVRRSSSINARLGKEITRQPSRTASSTHPYGHLSSGYCSRTKSPSLIIAMPTTADFTDVP